MSDKFDTRLPVNDLPTTDRMPELSRAEPPSPGGGVPGLPGHPAIPPSQYYCSECRKTWLAQDVDWDGFVPKCPKHGYQLKPGSDPA